MKRDLLHALNAAKAARRPVIRVIDLEGGESSLLFQDDAAAEELQPYLAEAFRSGRSRAVDIGGRRRFIEVHLPPARVVVIGAVHIAQPLAVMLRETGFTALIIDPRAAFATERRFTGTELVAEWPEEVFASFSLDRHTALVALTHDPKIDDYPIKAALEAGCFYVGALGSRKTHAKRVERLLNAGLPQHLADRIAAPVGLDIGAANPAEIAVAIMAEIVCALRKPASFRGGRAG